MEQEIRKYLDARRYREAFELMVGCYQHKVFRLAYSMLHNESVAEDLAQEIFMKVWRGLPGFNGQSSLSTWIYAIARNTCLTESKKASTRRALSLDQPEVGAVAEALQAQNLTASAPDLDVEAMVSRLPEKYRQVITLFYLEDRSYQEVSEMLGIPMGTVKTYLHRAKKELAGLAFGKAGNP